MSKTTQIVAAVVLTIAIALVAIFYAPKSSVTALDSKVDALSTDMKGYHAQTDLRIQSIEARTDTLEDQVTSIEADNDTLRALAERNARCVQKLYNEVVALGERLTETRNLTVTHGRKINDLSETIFKAAFGSAWADSGKAMWDKYVLCGNQEYWDEVVKRLSHEQMQKIIQVDQLNQRISALETSSP